jgi:pyruvate ferredoxin oxidoreductase alpha subunit
MNKIELLNGNEAAAYGAMLSGAEIIPVYPITPQTPLIHKISEFIAKGEFDADLIHLESDQSALAAAVGASLGGARVFTATNSQGLLYMAEVCYYASGLRVPIVMAVINRAVSSPHSRYPDHSDAMALKSSHWIQLFCETNQEVLDTAIQMFRICEDRRVLLPGMFSYESYLLSFTWENVEVPEQEKVRKFVGEYNPEHIILDPDDPMTINAPTTPDYLTEFRYKQKIAMDNALKVIREVGKEFQREFGRFYGLIDPYRVEDAEFVIATMGTIASTAKEVVDEMRAEGKKVGVLRIRSFRPFPREEVKKALKSAEAVATIDRNFSAGSNGALYDEMRSALYNTGIPVKGYIAGLGGRNVSKNDIREVFEDLIQKERLEEISWINLRG